MGQEFNCIPHFMGFISISPLSYAEALVLCLHADIFFLVSPMPSTFSKVQFSTDSALCALTDELTLLTHHVRGPSGSMCR